MTRYTKIFKGGSRLVVQDMLSDPLGPTAHALKPSAVTEDLAKEMYKWLNTNIVFPNDIEYRCTVVLECDYDIDD